MEIEPEKLKLRYKLEDLGSRDIETMDMIGRKRGFIMGNKELDYTRIATTVLNEFRDGKIGKITLEVPEDIKNQIYSKNIIKCLFGDILIDKYNYQKIYFIINSICILKIKMLE